MIELAHQSPVLFLPIFLDERELFCVVDTIDYTWAMQWLWRPKWDKHGRKAYATRSRDVGGDRNGNRKQVTVYLHKEITLRHLGPPPHPSYTIGDHKDGQSLNCRRHNMRWANSSMNRLNTNGWFARQHQIDFNKEMTT